MHKKKKLEEEEGVVQQPKNKLERHCLFIEAVIGCADCLEHAFEKIDFDKDQILGKSDLKQAMKFLEIDVYFWACDRTALREVLDLGGSKRIVRDDLRQFIETTAAKLTEKGGKNSFGQKRTKLGEAFASYLEHGIKDDPKKKVLKKDMLKVVSKRQLRRFLKETAPKLVKNVEDMLTTYTGDEIVSDAMREFGSAPQHTFKKRPAPKPWFRILGLTDQQTRQGVYHLQNGKQCGRNFYKCSELEPNDMRRMEGREGECSYIYYGERQQRWLIGPKLGCTTDYAMYSMDTAQSPEEISEPWKAYTGSGWRVQSGVEVRWPGQKELDPKHMADPKRRLPLNWAPPVMSRTLALFSYCCTVCPVVLIAVLCVLAMIYAIASCSIKHGCASGVSWFRIAG
jgi:hypothetical protein